MSVRRGISAKIRYGYNPLPKSSDRELLDAADVMTTRVDPAQPFELRWKYGSAHEAEFVVVGPGEFLPLRDHEVEEFRRAFEEQGGVVVDDPKARDEVRAAAIEGLTRAVAFWRDRGSMRLLDQQKQRGFTDQQMDQWRHTFWAYHLNAAKERAVQAELDRLTGRGRKDQ